MASSSLKYMFIRYYIFHILNQPLYKTDRNPHNSRLDLKSLNLFTESFERSQTKLQKRAPSFHSLAQISVLAVRYIYYSTFSLIIVTLLLTISPRVSQSGVIRLIPLVDLEYNIECTQNTFTNVKFEYYWLDVSQYFIFQALNTTMT